jgi:hypothetical protein
MIETFASLVTIIGGGIAVLQYFKRKQKNEAKILRLYLSGMVTTGEGVANRIIALFEAHDVKQTQIYRLLGDQFPEVTPSLDEKELQSLLSAELIDRVSQLFGVRKVWLEGEEGRIYEPLFHYKDFPAFVAYVRMLRARSNDDYCQLTAVKTTGGSKDLYKTNPEIALFFSEPIAEIGNKMIYRYHPIFGPFPWDHAPARFHLCAFFRVVYDSRLFPLYGYSGSQKQIEKISAGEVVPMANEFFRGRWHPEDYAYPESQFHGRVKPGDWARMLEYFDGVDVLRNFDES